MQTQLQTVYITFPNTFEVQGLEDIPLNPFQGPGIIECYSPKSIVEFTEYGVEQTFPDGMVKSWRTKPTLENAIKHKGGFFQFNSDGSVMARSRGMNSYWGPPKKGTPFSSDNFRATPEPNLRYSFWT